MTSMSSTGVEADQNCEGTIKRFFFKHIVKRQRKNNISLLQDEDGHLTVRDTDKVEMFNAFFASVFNTDDGLSWL